MISETQMIHTIVSGSDWQEVLTNIIAEEGMDPLQIDIVKLADAFRYYLERLKTFDFRVPARFILIAAILLRMKAELLLVEEEEKMKIKEENIPKFSLENLPPLAAPIIRKTTRKVTLTELINSLQKAFDFKEQKEEKHFRIRNAVEKLINEEEDVEEKIKRVFSQIMKKGVLNFSDLVPVWRRKEIVDAFLPMLYLSNRGKISCEQEEMFKEITIRVK
jgi:segregation and condensation protein A